MNFLDQLVAEWLSYKGYFVRTSIRVGPRSRGGYEGELDVVGFHPKRDHLVHVECSMDGLSREQREKRYSEKFDRGRRFIPPLFEGFVLPAKIDQIVVLMYSGVASRTLGGGRLVTAFELVAEIVEGLEGTSVRYGIVPEDFPLLRSIQLAKEARKSGAASAYLIPKSQSP